MRRLKRKKIVWGLLIIGSVILAVGISTIRIRRDFSVPLGGKYFLHRFNDRQILVAPLTAWDSSTPIIPERIDELDHDDKYVIAKQLHLRNANIDISSGPLMESDVASYWILRFSPPQVWGPMKQNDFDAQRQKLGVSISLKLHDVYDYQPD